MVNILNNEELPLPKLLTPSTVSFNNLTVSLDALGDITIETKGAWKGTMKDFFVVLNTAAQESGLKGVMQNGQDQ